MAIAVAFWLTLSRKQPEPQQTVDNIITLRYKEEARRGICAQAILLSTCPGIFPITLMMGLYAYGIVQSAGWAYLSTRQASSGRAHMHFLARYQFSTNLNQYNNRKNMFLDLYLNLQRFHGYALFAQVALHYPRF